MAGTFFSRTGRQKVMPKFTYQPGAVEQAFSVKTKEPKFSFHFLLQVSRSMRVKSYIMTGKKSRVAPNNFTIYSDLRERAHMIQRQLTQRVGYHYSYLNRLEKYPHTRRANSAHTLHPGPARAGKIRQSDARFAFL